MPIEKLPETQIMFEKQNFFSEHMANKIVKLYDKLNELIDAFNTREQDRSEQMARLVDKIKDIDNDQNSISREQTTYGTELCNHTFRLNALELKLENATQPKEENTILGCPWCNELPHISEGYSILLSHPPKFNYIIQCINKNCLINPKLAFSFNNMKEAIKAWNARK